MLIYMLRLYCLDWVRCCCFVFLCVCLAALQSQLYVCMYVTSFHRALKEERYGNCGKQLPRSTSMCVCMCVFVLWCNLLAMGLRES